jgi:hypothetical protein
MISPVISDSTVINVSSNNLKSSIANVKTARQKRPQPLIEVLVSARALNLNHNSQPLSHTETHSTKEVDCSRRIADAQQSKADSTQGKPAVQDEVENAKLHHNHHPETHPANDDPLELTPDEKKKLTRLQQIDQEIRIHEHLHAATGGPYVRGGPTFQLVLGPDGRQYAVGGHVDIDTTTAATPEETIRKARVIKAAATAPAHPSGADMLIAAQASMMEVEARAEQTRRMLLESKGEDKNHKRIQDQTQSDQLLSLLMQVQPLKLEEALQVLHSKLSPNVAKPGFFVHTV